MCVVHLDQKTTGQVKNNTEGTTAENLLSIILTVFYSFLPPNPILNRTIDSVWLVGQGRELDKTPIMVD